MPKGTLGIGVGVASLVLSGCIVTYNHNQMQESIERIQNKSNEIIEISETLQNENAYYKLKVSELESTLKTYKDLNEESRLKIEEFKQEQVRLKNELEKKEQKEQKVAMDTSSGDWVSYTQTHYTSYCNTGCTGKTASGHDVSKTIKYQGMRVIAVDPKRIPLGSIVEINDNGNISKAIALDTGGAIKGNKIDLLVSTNDSSYAYSLGVKKVKIKIVRQGWDKA